MTALSYQNSPELKSRFLAHVRRHQELDMVEQGTYGYSCGDGGWKGCAIACSARSLDEIDGIPMQISNERHAHVADRLGVPLWLARLEDSIFEGLDIESAKQWPARLALAIPVGRDLSMVWPRLALWMLSDSESGVLRLARSERSRKAIAGVVTLYERWVAGDKPSAEEWRKARAYAAAYAAATYTAAYSAYAADAAAYAADAAADAADAAAAAYAAAYAAYAAYAADARKLHWSRLADKLVSLLEAA